MNGAALASVAAGSGLQVALYLRAFGATHNTDGVIAALAVYSMVAVTAQILRTTAIPMLSGARPALTEAAFGWTMAGLTLVTIAVSACCAAPLAHLVAHSAGRVGITVATTSLRVLAPAIGLQTAGAGLAVIGALRGRLRLVASAYLASAVTGLVGYFALEAATGVQVLAWTNVISGATVVALLVPGLRVAPRHPVSVASMLRATGQLVHNVPLPASFIIMYPVTLALAPHSHAGDITLFGLAYTVCSYLAGFTAQALSMSDIVSLVRLDHGDTAARRAIVLRAFRYSLLLAAPVAGLAAVAGGPVVAALMPSRVGSLGAMFGTDILLLTPLLVATLGVWVTMPALLSTQHGLTKRGMTMLVLGLFAVHVMATLIGRALWGFDGVVIAMAVAPFSFVCVGLQIAAPDATRALFVPTLTICGVGALSFGVFALLIHTLAHEHGPVAGIIAAAAGTTAYVLLVSRAYPDETRTIMSVAMR